MKTQIKFIISLLAIIYSLGIYANATVSAQQSINSEIEWVLYKEIQGVKIFYSKQEYKNDIFHHEYIVFKYVNTNSHSIEFNWELDVW